MEATLQPIHDSILEGNQQTVGEYIHKALDAGTPFERDSCCTGTPCMVLWKPNSL
jgi:hypothetical protein